MITRADNSRCYSWVWGDLGTMSKKKKDNKNNQITQEFHLSRQVTDEDMDEIIIPFVIRRYSYGIRSLTIYLGVLMLLLFTCIHFADDVDIFELLKYGLGFLGFLLLIFAIFSIANTYKARKQYKDTLYITEVEFVEFSRKQIKTYSTKYKTLVVPSMVVNEFTKNGYKHSATYDCILQDTDHFSAGNSINRRLQKGDKVYKITNRKGQILYLIGEGKKHPKKLKQSKGVQILLSIGRAFVGCLKLGIVMLLLQCGFTLIRYVVDCSVYKTIFGFNQISWYCVFGEVSNIWEFLLFAFLLPAIVFVLILMLMPIMGTYTVDMFFGVGKKDK